ncbi:MAG: hypothetical protein EOP48_25835 [Sphingobacteriales bacterium]|nr:MAG: hypothetical protein EOP48_25835 [Sphingobacteriales bacterium]
MPPHHQCFNVVRHYQTYGEMNFPLILIALMFGFISNNGNKDKISVTWLNSLPGDFSFAKRKTITCEAWCYEWAGTDAAVAKRAGKDTVHCYTLMNKATHCSLNLVLVNDSCTATIELNSIVAKGDKIYPYKSGWIKIDKTLWKRNVLKAEFDFDFVNDENEKKVFWKGKIYTRIK